MATFTIAGFRMTGSNGSYTFLGSSELIVTAADNYAFTYAYLDPNSGSGVDVNDFGIPEIDFTDAGPYSSSFPDDENGVFTIFQINFSSGGTAQVLSMFDTNTGTEYIYFIGGTSTAVPTTAGQFNALVNDIGTVTQIPPSGPVSLATLPNTTVTDNEMFIEDRNLPETPESYDFGDGDDTAYTFEGTYQMQGGNGNDRLVAFGATNVTLYGGAGTDIMKFKGGTTGTMYGDAGDDKMIGDASDDFLYGGLGSDIVIGLAGDDYIYGRDESVTSGGLSPSDVGGDFLYGGRGNDYIYGNIGDDVLRGNRDHDIMAGRDGVDRMYGGGGNDFLDGEAGDDFLLGENGNDVFHSGTGNDRMTGGAGADTFEMDYLMGYDTILDFEVGVDSIDLSAFTGPDDFATFADVTAAASDRSSGVRIDLANDATLLLVGVTEAQLSAGDFIF